jgi:hypothetical protein
MTQLPSTLVETEMVQFAREWILRYSGNPWSPSPSHTADAGRALLRHMLRQMVLSLYAVHRMQVIARANAGDEDAAAVLSALIVERQSRGETLPTELAYYDMETHRRLLAGEIGHHRPPGLGNAMPTVPGWASS